MIRRASKTSYYLNRIARRLALIGRHIRLPAAVGTWVPVAPNEYSPGNVAEMLAANFPDLDAKNLPFIALLTDSDVDEFERELEEAGLLERDLPDTG